MFRKTLVCTSALALMFSMVAVADVHGDELTKESFLNKLRYSNHMGVKLGELAKDKAESEDVKALAERMIVDHRHAEERVKQVAQAGNIDLKSPDDFEKAMKEPRKDEDRDKKASHKEKMDRLRELSGAEFDREFTLMVNKGHDKTLGMFSQAQQQFTDDDVAELIAQLRPTYLQHEQRSEQLARQFGASEIDLRADRDTARL
jgi:putative membrane protein